MEQQADRGGAVGGGKMVDDYRMSFDFSANDTSDVPNAMAFAYRACSHSFQTEQMRGEDLLGLFTILACLEDQPVDPLLNVLDATIPWDLIGWINQAMKRISGKLDAAYSEWCDIRVKAGSVDAVAGMFRELLTKENVEIRSELEAFVKAHESHMKSFDKSDDSCSDTMER